ncbi:hypothetical protein DFH09DRAFT_921083, partial [Mycena vulgaris]
SESASYCSHLLRQGRGFPLYVPGPPRNLPEEYQQRGVAIGDVGRVTPDGVFDFFFNIYQSADDPINANFVPEDFSPLARFNPRDVVPREWSPGTYVSSPLIQDLTIRDFRTFSKYVIYYLQVEFCSDFGREYLFRCMGPSGAVLALPHGSHLEKLENVEPVRRYAAKYAESWYRYINGDRGRGLANGALYLITGCEKSWAGGMASFENVAPEQVGFQFSFRPTTTDGYGYRFQSGTPARTKHFGEEQLPMNQTTFIHGFSISLGEGTWGRLFGDATVSEITNFQTRNSQNIFVPFSSLFSWASFNFLGGATGRKEDITISDFSPTSEVRTYSQQVQAREDKYEFLLDGSPGSSHQQLSSL